MSEALDAKLGATQREMVVRVLNRAADDVLEVVDTGIIRDAINLVVNVFGEYLDNPYGDLESAIEHSYDANYDEVMGWFE